MMNNTSIIINPRKPILIGLVVSLLIVPLITVTVMYLTTTVPNTSRTIGSVTIDDVQEALRNYQPPEQHTKDTSLHATTFSHPQSQWYIARAASTYDGKPSHATVLLYNYGEAVVAHMVVDVADPDAIEFDFPVSVPIKVQRAFVEAAKQ